MMQAYFPAKVLLRRLRQQYLPVSRTRRRASENPRERWAELGDFEPGFLYPLRCPGIAFRACRLRRRFAPARGVGSAGPIEHASASVSAVTKSFRAGHRGVTLAPPR